MKHRVIVKIDLNALKRNYRRIVKRVRGAKVLSVLKANAYGLGVGAYAKALYAAGCRYFGVAEPFEALELIEVLGDKASVQLLSSVLPDEIEPMILSGVTLPLIDFESALLINRTAKKLGKVAHVQLKLDTGMGRLGFLADTPETIYKTCSDLKKITALEYLDLNGVFSHFPLAYEPRNEFSFDQIALFKRFLVEASEIGVDFKYVHIAASDAINNFPETALKPFNMVRTGLNLHGSFDPNGIKALKLEPVLTLTTRIAQIRSLPAGKTLGYGRTYRLPKNAKIATISAGYADGLPLALSNRGEVIIKGVRCPIVGRVSMDYTTVDVSRVKGELKPGDEVICFGKSGKESITPDDWALIKGTHAYDIICSLGSRVERETV